MYKLCKTEQSAARQRQLELGLLEAMKQQRYDEISISDLCEQMQIPRKSFYRYFSSKDGALHAMIDHILMEFEGISAVNRKGQHKMMPEDMESFFAFWMQHRELLDVMEKSNLSGVLIERAIFHALQEKVIPSKFFPEDSEEMQKYLTTFSVCGLMSMVITWHHQGFQKKAGEMGMIAARILAKPLFPNIC